MLKKTGMVLALSTALVAGGASAQTATTPMSSTPMSSAPTSSAPASSTMASSAAAPMFMTDQAVGQFRASKFIGLDVYGPDNQKVGDLNEILIDGTGQPKAAIIGVGGFLGIGEKNVAIPFTALSWVNARPVVATGSVGGVMNPAPVGMPAATGSAVDPNAGTTARPTRSPDENAAYQGHPDHATVTLTKADLQNAPAFKYYSDTHPSTVGSGLGAPTTSPMTNPRP